MVMSYSLFKENMEIIQNTASVKLNGKVKLDLVSYVELQHEKSFVAIQSLCHVSIVTNLQDA
jgi:hypothetical protein